MTNQEKKQAAMNLLALRPWGVEPPPNLPADLNELWLRHLEMLRGVMAELYAECFSVEQLQVQLDFYGSAMGKSIVAVDSEIASRFQERLRDLAPKLNEEASKYSSSVLGSVSNPLVPR